MFNISESALPFVDVNTPPLTSLTGVKPEVRHAWKRDVLNGERAHLKHVYGLLLHREHSQDVPVEVEALVVGQDDLVTLKGPGVTQSARMEVDNVEGVVF